ncbi:hypothetical protein QTP70_000061 [Hemibagrus guttatus]|uniref:C2H2-type domain-containing protein n=1 Tax=Hemibagrus guttatus TaxID=175788 RepID=A0AAE0RBJ0_9TELE|nr:hypothetical protein QTP70_000061 [Hemibagrus guttatus]
MISFSGFTVCSEYPVKDLHRQSPLRNSNKKYDERFSHITKEEVKIQDLANVTSVKEAMGQEEVYAALDLSVPRKNVRDNKEKCKWVLDPEYQISLIMEVDEIKDDTQHVEVVQDEDDEDYWSDSGHDHMNNFHLENWDQCPSALHVAIPSTYGSVMCPDPKDTLLIDDQGVPYTLTPDGQKVPQIDPSEMPVTATDESGSAESDIETPLAFQDAEPERELSLPDLILEDSSPSVSTESSQATIALEKKSPDDSTAETASTALSAMSTTLPSLPIQIMANNTDSNTPILLLPPSHLQTLTASEALLRLAVSAEQKNEKRPKCIDKSPVFNSSSRTEATQALEEHCNTDQVLPISEPEPVSADRTDSLLRIPPEDLPLQSSTSPPSPGSPILPTNHSKKQDPQALGPRRILYCQYCPRVFYYLSDLERHSITHSQKKPHICQLCSKAFKRSSHLERHKHIHTGERNFECQLCPRRFREAAELTRHQRVHTGEKPYQCLLCHMRFAERNTLRRHTKRKHQGQQQEAMNTKVKPETEGVSLVSMHEQQEENAEWPLHWQGSTEPFSREDHVAFSPVLGTLSNACAL